MSLQRIVVEVFSCRERKVHMLAVFRPRHAAVGIETYIDRVHALPQKDSSGCRGNNDGCQRCLHAVVVANQW